MAIITDKEFQELLEDVTDMEEHRHSESWHRKHDCMVCEVGHIVNRARGLQEFAITAIAAYVLRGDPNGLNVLLAILFCAGMRYGEECALNAMVEGKS